MRLVTFKRCGEDREQVGVWTDGGVVPASALGLEFDSMNDLILRATPDDMAALRAAKAEPIPCAWASITPSTRRRRSATPARRSPRTRPPPSSSPSA